MTEMDTVRPGAIAPLDWDYDTAREARETYMSPSLATFQAYDQPLLLKSGRGQYLWDADGKRYLDCIAQNVCISVGHCHPLVNAAAKAQIDELVHCTTMWMHPAPGALAKELIDRLPAGEDWVVHLVNTGSEAIDLAILLARAYTRAGDILALRRAYHGLHFAAASATGLAIAHQPVPPTPGYHHVSVPDQYRGIYGAGVDNYVAEVKATIESSTPGQVAGLIYEPIQGFGGVTPLPVEYIPRVADIVRAAGGLMIADEVQTGFGRMGDHYWGFERFDVTPDIVVMAKGIGNGFPLAAVVSRREIARSITQRKFFNTYGANPVCAAAGRAVLAAIDGEGLQENARVVGAEMFAALQRLQDRHEMIGDVRGQGLMMGIEIVASRDTREPAPELAGKINERLRERGVIMSKSGANGNVLRILPPMCVTADDVVLLEAAVDEACASC
jgi:alanine-glyoxylate transaminase / (R)-3-amino-2-methylpropionate-pyruvate transaminase